MSRRYADQGCVHTSAEDRDPYFDEGMRRWIASFARKNYWRVHLWYSDVSDLIQDGALCYCKCRARYVDELGRLPASDPTPENRKHMMALVKTTFIRHIRFTIAGKMQHGREIPVSQLVRPGEDEVADPWESIASTAPSDTSLLALLRSLPKELQDLVVVLGGDGAEALGFRRTCLEERVLPSGGRRVVRRGRRRLRETSNQYYCRLLGLDPASNDLAGQVQTLRNSLSDV